MYIIDVEWGAGDGGDRVEDLQLAGCQPIAALPTRLLLSQNRRTHPRTHSHRHTLTHRNDLPLLPQDLLLARRERSTVLDMQVILRLSHLPLRKDPTLLAEIVINLDALASRKVQFFPFGSNDRVLKIVIGPPQTPQGCPLHCLSPSSPNDNEAFLREKQQFLQRVITNSSSSSLRQDLSRSKKSFSQRARDLLDEVQGMKGGGRQDGRSIEQEFNDYCQDPISSYYVQQDRMITSKHKPKIK